MDENFEGIYETAVQQRDLMLSAGAQFKDVMLELTLVNGFLIDKYPDISAEMLDWVDKVLDVRDRVEYPDDMQDVVDLAVKTAREL